MERANCIVRLAGSITNTVPKFGVTPAEVIILRRKHGGDDAVVDIRPTGDDPKIRSEQEYERLAQIYDNGGEGFGAGPDEERTPLMERLFPGALRKLPQTFAEAGIDTGALPAVEPVPDLPDATDDEPKAEAEADEPKTADAEGGEGATGETPAA